jgi:hypothetical protein
MNFNSEHFSGGLNMKKMVAVMMLIVAATGAIYSQNSNWRAFGEDQHNSVQFSFGYDYGMSAQMSYSRRVSWFRPVLLHVEYSFPMGKTPLDDFKVRLGGQMEIVEAGGFSAAIRVLSNFRRYENAMARILSFGSDVAALAGYYQPAWHAAGEFGFDKAITSHLKNSDLMRESFPSIRDGWYIPTGGHYYYGIQAGKTVGDAFEFTLRIGATNAQDHDENDVIPYYAQMGFGVRF